MAIQGLLNDDAIVISNKMMEIATERQKVIANNMANANTPGYTRMELDFQQRLTDIVRSGDLEDLSSFHAKAVEDKRNSPSADGNNVLIANEMNEMAQNSVMFSLLSKAFSTRLGIIKAAMKSS